MRELVSWSQSQKACCNQKAEARQSAPSSDNGLGRKRTPVGVMRAETFPDKVAIRGGGNLGDKGHPGVSRANK